MSVIDPVADMLTRVRNACLAGHRRVDMPVSKLKVAIAAILRDYHYIQDYKVLDDGQHGLLRLYLKYHNDAPVIRELQRVSSPGLRRYYRCQRCGRSRGTLRKFKLCRICFRELALRGEIPGVRKASW